MERLARPRFADWKFLTCLTVLLIALMSGPMPVHAQARIELPRTGLAPDELAVIINDSDPQSLEVADYYQKARHIPAANMIHLNFPSGRNALSRDEFQQLKAEIDQATPLTFKPTRSRGRFPTG